MRYAVLPILALAAMFLLSACAVDADLSGPRRVYIDEPVERPDGPEIYVQPMNRPLMPQTVLFIPFRINPSVDQADFLETELSRTFWRTWLAAGVSPVLAFDEGRAWRGEDDAVSRARKAGADLAVSGEITYLMFGGTTGQTAVSLRLYVLDAATGTLLWSMAHAGHVAMGPSRDYIFFTQHSRMPADPMHVILTTLAHEMAQPVRFWNNPVPEDQDEEKAAEEIPPPSPLG